MEVVSFLHAFLDEDFDEVIRDSWDFNALHQLLLHILGVTGRRHCIEGSDPRRRLEDLRVNVAVQLLDCSCVIDAFRPLLRLVAHRLFLF
jgi:hypothetical protein